jgi:hypothetical protein
MASALAENKLPWWGKVIVGVLILIGIAIIAFVALLIYTMAITPGYLADVTLVRGDARHFTSDRVQLRIAELQTNVANVAMNASTALGGLTTASLPPFSAQTEPCAGKSAGTCTLTAADAFAIGPPQPITRTNSQTGLSETAEIDYAATLSLTTTVSYKIGLYPSQLKVPVLIRTFNAAPYATVTQTGMATEPTVTPSALP